MKIKKFARLTFNSNGWQKPSGHPWEEANQKKDGIPFENRYGYGHEEWLFNPKFQLDGYQYGYVRGLTMNKTDFFDEVHLYTVKKEKNANYVYYVGYINNIEGIINDEEIQNNVAPEVFDSYFKDMLIDIKEAGGDPTRLKSKGYYHSTIRFRIKDMHLESEPLLIPNFDLVKYNRFTAYNFNGIFSNWITKAKMNTNGFRSGEANQTRQYSKTTSSKVITVDKYHSEIISALKEYLKPEYNKNKKNISIEKTNFNSHIGDVVTMLKNGSIDIYEIKTTSNGRKNIREALAQLLDYAVHAKEEVNELFVVSPALLDSDTKLMISKLNKLIELPISYLYYDSENKKIMPICLVIKN